MIRLHIQDVELDIRDSFIFTERRRDTVCDLCTNVLSIKQGLIECAIFVHFLLRKYIFQRKSLPEEF